MKGGEDDPAHVLQHAPPGFFFGAAESAYQTEGGNENDWTDWEQGSYPDGRPHVKGGVTAARTTDAWNDWPEDVAAAQTLGANMLRVGLEWSRLEPREGEWNEEAVARYRAFFRALRRAAPRSIEPMVTLWHFTLPRWLAQRGGWEAPDALDVFARYVRKVAASFGDEVDWWCTLNEPNVFVAKGYLAAEWPPGVKDPLRAARVLATLLRAHGRAAAELRAVDRTDADGDGHPTRIGLAHNVRIFDPASSHPADALAAAVADTFYNETTVDAVATGRVRIRLPGAVTLDEPAPELLGSFDYLGLNYYTRDFIQGPRWGGAPYQPVRRPGLPRTDMGWEIYPAGLERLLLRYRHRVWPLFVTENGLADREGHQRSTFLLAHLSAVDRALEQGAPVIGYLFWSLTDNFEWSHGFEGRFGLFAVDFAHRPFPSRTATAAVTTFAAVASSLGRDP